MTEGGKSYIWRRSEDRLRAPLPCRWGATDDCAREGVMEGLSANGCFVSAEVESIADETLFVKIPSPTGRWLTFAGRPVYFVRRRGFALEFRPETSEARELLRQVVEFYQDGR